MEHHNNLPLEKPQLQKPHWSLQMNGVKLTPQESMTLVKNSRICINCLCLEIKDWIQCDHFK